MSGISGRVETAINRDTTPGAKRKIQRSLQNHTPTEPDLVPQVSGGGDPNKNNLGYARKRKRGSKVNCCKTEIKATPGMQECIHFLSQSVGKDESILRQELESFPHKDKLKQLLNHMMSTGMGGWRDNGLYLVSESGRCASKGLWNLVDGKLVLKDSKTCPCFDIDKIWRVRSLI